MRVWSLGVVWPPVSGKWQETVPLRVMVLAGGGDAGDLVEFAGLAVELVDVVGDFDPVVDSEAEDLVAAEAGDSDLAHGPVEVVTVEMAETLVATEALSRDHLKVGVLGAAGR